MRLAVLAPLMLTACASIQTPPGSATTADRAARWVAHVQALSSDAMEGRAAGTAGHERAVQYVVGELRRLSLQPAGTDGFLQSVALVEQQLDYATSSASLSVGGTTTPVRMPATAIVLAGRPLPVTFDAPLVFLGYGLHLPSHGHDDFAGVDLRGKIAVFVSGGPANIAGSAKANARAQRTRLLAERGAIGSIDLSTPGQMEAPWSAAVRNSEHPAMYLADAELRSEPRPFISLRWNPAEAQLLFAGQSRTFPDIAQAADESRPLPGFDLGARLAGRLAASQRAVASPNVVARLSGRDPVMADEHVVVTAHLDALGAGKPVNGDAINNGALDNASGVAALLDIAEELRRRRPRRSILFVFVTAEEKGLLGSRYFARRPTVPRSSIVANLNYDMALPIFPLRSVTVQGAEESSIGSAARDVGAIMSLPLTPDPFPNRNAFIRSDQYAFIEQGIPSAAFKFGFVANTPEAELERAFRATRYHNLSDDLSIPIFREDEIRLHDFMTALILRLADADERPRWNAGSIFAVAPGVVRAPQASGE